MRFGTPPARWIAEAPGFPVPGGLLRFGTGRSHNERMDQNPIATRAHEWLAQSVGTWDVTGLYYIGPGQDPLDAKGTETIQMMGPFWQRGDLRIELFDSVIEGVTYLGFHPMRQVFISTWIDSANPYLYGYEGSYDEATRLLSLTGTNTDPATGKPATYRSLAGYDLPNERSLSLTIESPGRNESEILSYEYKRR